MPSLKIVSSAEGVKLLRRNRFDGTFDKIACHYCDTAANPSKVMSYHAMFKELNDKRRVINTAPQPWGKIPPWYDSVLFRTPVYYSKYLWSHSKTVGVSMSDALHLDNIRRKECAGILVFAPQPLSTIIYRLYKQLLPVIEYDLSIVIVNTKLDKTISKYYSYNAQIETLAQNSLFGGYNARRLIKFNGVYLNTRLMINPHNSILTKDSCRALTQAEKECLNPVNALRSIIPEKSGQ